MASKRHRNGWMLPAAMALMVACAAAQAPAPKPGPGKGGEQKKAGGVKGILDHAQQMRPAGAAHAAAVEQAQTETGGAPAGTTGAAATARAGSAAKQAASKPGERRDPFVNPIRVTSDAGALPTALPPGNAGLVIGQASLVGVVKTTQGMKAVMVGSNGRTYFLKENEKVYNGRVTKITADTLVFEETMVDPLGQTVRREVTKKLPAEK